MSVSKNKVGPLLFWGRHNRVSYPNLNNLYINVSVKYWVSNLANVLKTFQGFFCHEYEYQTSNIAFLQY